MQPRPSCPFTHRRRRHHRCLHPFANHQPPSPRPSSASTPSATPPRPPTHHPPPSSAVLRQNQHRQRHHIQPLYRDTPTPPPSELPPPTPIDTPTKAAHESGVPQNVWQTCWRALCMATVCTRRTADGLDVAFCDHAKMRPPRQSKGSDFASGPLA